MILPRNFPRTILLCIYLASTILIQALAKDVQCIQIDDITFPTVSDCISAVEMMPLSSRIDHRVMPRVFRAGGCEISIQVIGPMGPYSLSTAHFWKFRLWPWVKAGALDIIRICHTGSSRKTAGRMVETFKVGGTPWWLAIHVFGNAFVA